MPNKIGDHLHAMKLYRGLRPRRVQTDSKKPEDYIEEWRNGEQIWLKGTKTSHVDRETDLFLELEDKDVIALFHTLIERLQDSDPQEALQVSAETMTRMAGACQRVAMRMSQASDEGQ